MQFQTSDEHPNSNQSNCFLPSTLSGESAASSETCLQQGLFGRNNRMIPPSPRPIRFWRGSYTSRHELLFFPNDELDWPCEEEEEEQDSSCDLEEESLSEVETWEMGQTVKDVDKGSVSQEDMLLQDCQNPFSDKRHTSDGESSSLVSEERSCVTNPLATE
ncbi:hypothetical protein Gasu2_07690 [Galdieria sulphuraria]|nr:hypothetical protein Gasu2_07690 [Galdieria sulphuraria]